MLKLKSLLKGWPKKQLLLAGSAFAVIALGAGAYWWAVYRDSSDSLVCSVDKEGSLLRRAADSLNEPRNDDQKNQLAEAVAEIEAAAGHQEDVNCLYPMAIHYLNAAEADKAKAAIEKLEQLIDQGALLHDSFTYRLSIRDLKQRAEHLETYEERIQDNTLIL